jgi:hypothetical protein
VETYPTTPDKGVQQRQATVTIEAFDAIFLLNQAIDGFTYPLGIEGETTPKRLGTLASVGSFQGGQKLDQTVMPHRNVQSTNPIWSSMVVTAQSDGGEVFIDNDGALMYLGRDSMVHGRKDHAQPYCVFTDSCPSVNGTTILTFADGLPQTSDTLIVNDVILTNVDGLQATASDQNSMRSKGKRLLNPAQSSQTWSDQAQATNLASDLLSRYVNATYFINPLTVASGTIPDLRIGDLIRYVRTLPSGLRIDANLRVTALGWSVTPDASGTPLETLSISTSPVTAFNAFSRFGTAVWATQGTPQTSDALWAL